MISPAMRHKERWDRQREAERLRTVAAAAEEHALQRIAEDDGQQQLLLANLDQDCKRISALPQGAARLPLKRECVALYMPIVEQYLAGDAVRHNPVLVQVMVWLFDLGDIAAAMRLAERAIADRQPMPERFKSTLPVFVVDAVLEWARIQRQGGGAVEPYLGAIYGLMGDLQLHDAQRAKVCKLRAEVLAEQREFRAAYEACCEAQIYDPAAQVKTLKSSLEKELKKLAESERYAPPAGGGSGSPDPEPGSGNPADAAPSPASSEKKE